ncbi:hypothetical protein C0Q70_20074 [Pomacea canaliculata]|uniref:Uncharacterized protein n=1 Tax=Pomacea canaliculata TaxID=400727 RepID=A0A2T7NEI3_POMCA|nr:hypothetical protein C0Q70_20074 [Pomacea canaliculata]
MFELKLCFLISGDCSMRILSFLWFLSIINIPRPSSCPRRRKHQAKRKKKNKMLFQHFCFNMRHSSCTLATHSSLASVAVATGMAIRVEADNVFETHASALLPISMQMQLHRLFTSRLAVQHVPTTSDVLITGENGVTGLNEDTERADPA